MSDIDIIRRLRAIEKTLDRLKTGERGGATGTWTPAFVGTGTAGTFTYAGQLGVWTQFGNQIIIHAFVAISAITVPPVGNMTITGLPFTAANAGMDFSIALGYVSNVNTSANIVQLTAFVQLNTTTILLMEAFDNAASTQFPAANFTNAAAAIELSGVYQIP